MLPPAIQTPAPARWPPGKAASPVIHIADAPNITKERWAGHGQIKKGGPSSPPG